MSRARALFNHTFKPPYVFARGQVTHALDRRAGIRTEGHLTPEQLGFSGEHQERYQPSHWTALPRALPRGTVTPEDVFIDFGSGMGRIVYQAASRYAFGRVIGVELSQYLHAIAVDNIERNRHRLRCGDVQLVCSDALEYEIPADVTVVYLGNPFSGPIFASVLDRLVATTWQAPRRLRIVYTNPVEEQIVLGHGFELKRTLRGMRPTEEWSRSNSTRLYERPPTVVRP